MWRAVTRRDFYALLSVFVISSVGFGQVVNDATNIDSRWNRSWPAGPFSKVSSSWGVLQTNIPLCSLDGPGATSIDFSLYHRSNQSNTQMGFTNGGAGRGWTTNAIQTVQVNNGVTTWYRGGNATASWTIVSVSGGRPTYARTADTRFDIFPNMVGTTVRGWDIVSQGDKTVYRFRQEVIDQTSYRLSQVIDAHGNTVNYAYDASDRVTRITDASGVRNIQIGYTVETTAQVAWVRLNFPSGTRQWDFTYASGHLARVDFPAPLTGGTRPNVRFNYSSANTNIWEITDLRGNLWHYAYASVPSLAGVQAVVGVYPPSLTSPNTNWDSTGTLFSYSLQTTGAAANWTKTCNITDRRGQSWRHVYYYYGPSVNDWFANPIKQAWDGGLLASDLYTWNAPAATIATYTDRRGNPASYTYDARGNMLTKTDREGWLWRWVYFQDKVVTQIDPTLNRTIYAYYDQGWGLASVIVDPKTDPFDSGYSKPAGVALKTNYTYTPTGELATTWKGTDLPATYSNYDVYGNCETLTSPLGIITSQVFDDLNNKTSVTPPSPAGVTSYTYDNWNRLLRTTYPGGSYTENTYDGNGNVVSVRDPNGFTVTHTFNAWNWLGGTRTPVDATAANDIIVEYFYDADGHCIRVENGRDKSTFYDITARGEVWRIRYPDNTSRSFEFDGNGNRTKRWDGQNRLTTYTYDKEDRPRITTYPNSTTINNAWRSDGIRSQTTDSTGTTTYNYNGAKQLKSVIQPLVSKTVNYDYDAAGRRLNTGLMAQTWSNVYDAGGRLREIRQNIGAATVAKFDYYVAGPVWRRTNGNNTAVYYDYDARLRPTAISHRNISGGEIEQQRLEYTYDNNGNILTAKNMMIAGSSWNTTYIYDRANRLRSETRTGGVGFNFTNAYTYDKSNNRIGVVRDGITSNYTVDDNDKLLTGDGFTFSGYSADGNPGTINQTGFGSIAIQYDYENRPTRIDYPGGYSTFRYNGDGQRVEKFDSIGSVTTRYVYDGPTLIAETNSLNQVTIFFLPGVGYNGSGGSQYFDRENAQGSSLVTTNSTSAIESIKEYDAYGVIYQVLAGRQSSFLFLGKHGYYSDGATGLQLGGARFYMSRLGRFLTQNPLGQVGGLNLYEFSENNPLTSFDKNGLGRIQTLPGKGKLRVSF